MAGFLDSIKNVRTRHACQIPHRAGGGVAVGVRHPDLVAVPLHGLPAQQRAEGQYVFFRYDQVAGGAPRVRAPLPRKTEAPIQAGLLCGTGPLRAANATSATAASAAPVNMVEGTFVASTMRPPTKAPNAREIWKVEM